MDKFKNQLVADKSGQTKQKTDKNFVQTSPEQLNSQVDNLENKTADDCSKEILLNDAPINPVFDKAEVASVKNSIDDLDLNGKHTGNNCADNPASLVNKTVNSSEAKLLNKFASENENLKYRISTSNTLERLLR